MSVMRRSKFFVDRIAWLFMIRLSREVYLHLKFVSRVPIKVLRSRLHPLLSTFYYVHKEAISTGFVSLLHANKVALN